MRRYVSTKLVGFIKVQSLRSRGDVVAAVSKPFELRWATWNSSLPKRCVTKVQIKDKYTNYTVHQP